MTNNKNELVDIILGFRANCEMTGKSERVCSQGECESCKWFLQAHTAIITLMLKQVPDCDKCDKYRTDCSLSRQQYEACVYKNIKRLGV